MLCLQPNAIRRERGEVRFLGPYRISIDINDRTVEAVPCLKCDNCQSNRRRMWSYRIMLEAIGKKSCFLTLTYDDDHNPTVVVRPHIQKFLDAARKYTNFKFYYTGEYGEKTFRPHWHVCVLGSSYDEFPISKLYRQFYNGSIWPHGHIHVGELNVDSAAYCAGYTTKKENAFVPEIEGCLYPTLHGQSKGLGLSCLTPQFVDYMKSNRYVKTRHGNFAIPRYFLQKIFDTVEDLDIWKAAGDSRMQVFPLDIVKQIRYNMKQRRGYSDPVL